MRPTTSRREMLTQEIRAVVAPIEDNLVRRVTIIFPSSPGIAFDVDRKVLSTGLEGDDTFLELWMRNGRDTRDAVGPNDTVHLGVGAVGMPVSFTLQPDQWIVAAALQGSGPITVITEYLSPRG